MKTDNDKLTVLNNLMKHYGPQHWWEDSNKVEDWVTMILIQQSTAVNVEKAINNLRPYLSFEGIHNLQLADLQEMVRPAGFYKQKSNYIQAISNWFASYHNDLNQFDEVNTSELRKELLGIKGVGAETADVMLLYIFNRNTFVADQYAMRLFNRLEFGKYEKYDQMRDEFEPLVATVSQHDAREWHAVIDEHGKQFRRDQKMDESWLLR